LGAAFGFEAFIRYWLLFLPSVAYFGVVLLNNRITVVLLLLILVLAGPLHIVSHFGNSAIDYISPSLIASSQFLNNKTSHGYITGNVFWKYTDLVRHRWVYGTDSYRDISFEKMKWEGGNLSVKGKMLKNYPYYITIGYRDKALYDFFYNKLSFIETIENSLRKSKNCNQIYENVNQKIYYNYYNKISYQ